MAKISSASAFVLGMLGVCAGACRAATPIVPPLNGATAGQWQYLTLGNGFLYDVLLPYQYSTSYIYPVVLYLHGLGTAAPPGTPPPNAFTQFMNNVSVAGINYRADYPAIVVAPQCPNSAIGTNDWGGTETTRVKGKLANTDMPCGDNAMTALQTVLATYSADPSKIYITGYSMGGFGAYYRYATNLNIFAAAIPVSGAIDGGATESFVEKLLRQSPLWAFHGFDDQTVPKTWDEHMYTTSQKRGGVMQYVEFVIEGDKTKYPHWLEQQDGDGHANADISAFSNTATMNWLFAQSR